MTESLAVPVIAEWNSRHENNILQVQWDTWGGEKATLAQLFINGDKIDSHSPKDQDGQSGQTGLFHYNTCDPKKSDNFTLHVVISNDHGTSSSEPYIIADKEDESEEIKVDPEQQEDMESFSYYLERINQFRTSDWFTHFSKENPEIAGNETYPGLSTLEYYVRVDGDVDLSKITEEESEHNPENVNRVIRLMPKAQFEITFPLSTEMNEIRSGYIPGKIFSYINFLKAVAVVPGYAGSYNSFPEAFKSPEMEVPDVVAKKFIATTLAHAVQETSNTGQASDLGNYEHKVPGTFAEVGESGGAGSYGPNGLLFGPGMELHYLAKDNYYYGRGAKQLSYVDNYANQSMLLYGDLRLVAYPSLIEEPSCLGFLTALLYTLMPKAGLPSCAEIMDGTWQQLLNDPKTKSDNATAVETYNRDFPITVILVNGGPEGYGVTDPKIVANSKVRIDSYNGFSTTGPKATGPLLDPAIEYEVEDNSSVIDLNYKCLGRALNEGVYDQCFIRKTYYDKGNIVSWDSGLQIFGGSALEKIALS